jgi:hypothetical protein
MCVLGPHAIIAIEKKFSKCSANVLGFMDVLWVKALKYCIKK